MEFYAGRSAGVYLRRPDDFLCLTAVGWYQCLPVRTSNAMSTHPIAQCPTADPQEARCLYDVAPGLAERLLYPGRRVQGLGPTTGRRRRSGDGPERSR